MGDMSSADIAHLLEIAGLDGFTGKYDSLGGGEVNNTYKVYLDDSVVILRVAKDEGQTTLEAEAHTLAKLNSPRIPQVVYFNKNSLVGGKAWIIESYVSGVMPGRLSLKQFFSLGQLLAEVHKVHDDNLKVNLRGHFLDISKSFGNETTLLNHPDENMRALIKKAFDEFKELQPKYDLIAPSLTHSDATPSNILVNGDQVGLIDWEFSKFGDPMLDFSTVYYEDIEYNRGKWRIKIEPEEKIALFDGYESIGGVIDEERIRFWIRMDKLGAATFLYWRINESKRPTSEQELDQYKLDYKNLIASLQN